MTLSQVKVGMWVRLKTGIVGVLNKEGLLYELASGEEILPQEIKSAGNSILEVLEIGDIINENLIVSNINKNLVNDKGNKEIYVIATNKGFSLENVSEIKSIEPIEKRLKIKQTI